MESQKLDRLPLPSESSERIRGSLQSCYMHMRLGSVGERRTVKTMMLDPLDRQVIQEETGAVEEWNR